MRLPGGGYDGGVVVAEGLLSMAGLPTGTLELLGGTFETTATGTLAALAGARDGEPGAVVLNHAADLTVAGDVAFPRKALVKRGAGTLTFAGSSLAIPNPFTGSHSSDMNGMISFGAQGETPEGGCSALTVTEGTVVFDNPDATSELGNLAVGRWTMQDAPAHAILRNGNLRSYLVVGRGHGGAGEGEPMEATLTIESGAVTSTGVSIGSKGERPDYRGRAVLTLAGGTLDVTSGEPLNIGEDSGAWGVYRQTGGESTFSGGNVKIGHKSPGGHGEILLEGGGMTVENVLDLGVDAAATGTLYLGAGARLACTKLQVGRGTGTVRFDGGTLNVQMGPIEKLRGVVEAGGAVFEIESSRVTNALRLQAGETAGGGLVKRGPGELRMGADVKEPVDDYAGGVRLEDGSITVGTARAPFPVAAAVETAAGTKLDLSVDDGVRHVVRVGSASLNGALALRVGDRLDVAGALAFGPQAQVLVFAPDSMTLPNRSLGVFTICTYGGAAPDVSHLAVGNPADGFTYALAAADGRVTLTIAASEGTAFDAVWNVDADGAWGTAANWRGGLPPVATGSASFLAAVTAPRTVTVAGDVTVAGLTFDNANAYTLAGSGTLTLAAGEADSATLQARRGTHRIEMPVVAQGPLQVMGDMNVVLANGLSGDQVLKNGAGRLTLGAVSTAPVDMRAGTLDVSGGTLAAPVAVAGGRLAADSAEGSVTGPVRLAADMTLSTGQPLLLAGDVSGAGTLTSELGTLRLGAVNSRTGATVLTGGRLELVGGTPGTGSFTYRGGTLAASGEAESVVPAPVKLESDVVIDAAGPLTLKGGLTSSQRRSYQKTGGGTLTLCGSTVNQPGYLGRFRLDDGTLRLAEGAELVLPLAAADDAQGEDAVRGQFTLNGAAASRRGIVLEKGSRLASGGWFLASEAPANGERGVCDITINGGVMEALWGKYGFIVGDVAGTRFNVRMNGGEVRSRPNVYTDLGTRAPIDWIVDGGGEVHLGWTACGRQAVSGSGRQGGGVRIWVKDGLFDAGQMFSWQSTDDPAMTNIVTVGAGTRATNAVFATVPTIRPGTRGHAEFVFDGGLLRAVGAATTPPANAAGTVANYLNGVDAVRVGPGGAGIETAAAITLPNELLAQPEGDGGIYKLGSGKVTLGGSLASVTGAVEVLEGTLAATVVNANNLLVADGATFDLSLGTAASGWTFGVVSGCGSVVNGTLMVSGALAPGDAAGEVGTFHAENLSFAKGAKIRIDRAETAGDMFEVSGTLTMAGGGVLDFGHEEGDVVAIPLSGVLGTVGVFSGSTGGWRAEGLGYPPGRRLAANLRVADGVVTYTVRDSGLVLIYR